MPERRRQSSQQAQLLFWYPNWIRQIYHFFCEQSKTLAEKWEKKPTNIRFWWWSVSGAAGQKRCLPLHCVSHFLQHLTFFSLTPVSNCSVNFYWRPSEFTLGTTYNPHSQEAEHCSMSDSAVQEWQHWAELGARRGDEVAGPVAITITNCSPLLSRQSQTSKGGLRSS